MKEQLFENLRKSMLDYDEKSVNILVSDAINSKINPLEIVDVFTQSMAEVGDGFEKGELFLPDLMMAAETMNVGMAPIEKMIIRNGLKKKTYGKIVIGTVFGDIHDIGKNIVATLLSANGFDVIDIGANAKSDRFIEAVKQHNPNILAMSALLTTTAPEQGRVIMALKEVGIRSKIKIMVGGGSITREFAQKIGADGYEPTAPLAVKLAKKFVGKS